MAAVASVVARSVVADQSAEVAASGAAAWAVVGRLAAVAVSVVVESVAADRSAVVAALQLAAAWIVEVVSIVESAYL